MRLRELAFKRILFVLFLLALSIFILLKHREIEDRGSLHWYERPLIFVTTPITQGLRTAGAKMHEVLQRYFFLSGVEKENERLHLQIEEEARQAMLSREIGHENERLRSLLALQSRLQGEWVAARVASYPPIGPYRLLTIDKGEEAGIKRGAPVVSSGGLVGQVARVQGRWSQVLLMTDPTSAVDGRIENTEARGLVVGSVRKMEMNRDLFIGTFEYLNQSVDIAEGAAVLTSGLDGVYPAGLLIGFVQGNKKKKFNIFQQAEVIPAVDFYKLQEVLVFTRGEKS